MFEERVPRWDTECWSGCEALNSHLKHQCKKDLIPGGRCNKTVCSVGFTVDKSDVSTVCAWVDWRFNDGNKN